MKKFYKTVSLGPPSGKGYALLLDGKGVQTPARQPLYISALPLAETIANEWREQGDEVVPDTMPLTQMAMTLIDRVLPNRPALEAEALGYLDTDLICYFAAEPEEYKRAQEDQWNPVHAWFRDAYGVALQTTTGLTPLTQSPALHDAIRSSVARMSMSEFMALYLVTLGAGSLVLALGFVAGALPPQQVLDAAFAEEKLKDKIYLGDIYGSAPDQERRVKILQKELDTLQRFLILQLPAI